MPFARSTTLQQGIAGNGAVMTSSRSLAMHRHTPLLIQHRQGSGGLACGQADDVHAPTALRCSCSWGASCQPSAVCLLAVARQEVRALRVASRSSGLAARAASEYTEYVGSIVGHDLKFGIVVGRFNDLVTKLLLEGALDHFERHGTSLDDVDVSAATFDFYCIIFLGCA